MLAFTLLILVVVCFCVHAFPFLAIVPEEFENDNKVMQAFGMDKRAQGPRIQGVSLSRLFI